MTSDALGQRLFKTEPQFPPAAGDESDPTFMASLIAFFSKLDKWKLDKWGQITLNCLREIPVARFSNDRIKDSFATY